MEKIFSDKTLDELLHLASQNPRLRVNLDLRDDPQEESQRMLNAIMPGSILPIHRHTTTSEVIMVLKGEFEIFYYDEKGNQTDSVILNPDSGTYGISIPAGQWHNSKANVPTVIIESKAGHYKPLEPADILIPEA